MEDKQLIKSDPTLLHTLPFSASLKRSKSYHKVSKWGDLTITIESLETINAHDLLTLLHILKIYLQKTGIFKTITKEDSIETILQGTLKLSDLVKRRHSL